VQVAVTCAAGPKCSGTASFSVALGNAGAKRSVLLAAGHFALNAGKAGAISLPVSKAGRQLMRLGTGTRPDVAGNLTIALLGGKKTEHRVTVR
jgi:hypothetical protein